MSVSHKRTFFENIAAYDDRAIAREVQRLLAENRKENRHVDPERFRRELAQTLSPERVERVMDVAMRPYAGPVARAEKIITGADLARAQRKALKSNMRSRRKSR
jgi:hypothetical protein